MTREREEKRRNKGGKAVVELLAVLINLKMDVFPPMLVLFNPPP